MKNMFEFRTLGRAKTPIFSTISCAAAFMLLIFADSFIYNLSLHSIAFGTQENFPVVYNRETGGHGKYH